MLRRKDGIEGSGWLALAFWTQTQAWLTFPDP
jgi:hypothetical protein